MHGRQAPQRRDDRGDRRPAAGGRGGGQGRPPRPGARVRLAAKTVAMGGGHGLAASLSALRHVVTDLTAVVTVADNGGSSGRLRKEYAVLPPGDLRMALAALCGDDDWGRTWARVLQHRFPPDEALHGHAVGNLLRMALWDLIGTAAAWR